MRTMGTSVRVVLCVVEDGDQMLKVLRQLYMCVGHVGKATTRDEEGYRRGMRMGGGGPLISTYCILPFDSGLVKL